MFSYVSWRYKGKAFLSGKHFNLLCKPWNFLVPIPDLEQDYWEQMIWKKIIGNRLLLYKKSVSECLVRFPLPLRETMWQRAFRWEGQGPDEMDVKYINDIGFQRQKCLWKNKQYVPFQTDFCLSQVMNKWVERNARGSVGWTLGPLPSGEPDLLGLF